MPVLTALLCIDLLRHALADGLLPRPHGLIADNPRSAALKPIRGSFLDIQYDGRLKYANNVTLQLSCAAWEGKVDEWASMGLHYLIFQAVHDERFGAYYNSSLHKHWAGACPDAVGAIMRAAAGRDIKVWLSCEYTNTDADGVSDPILMQGRYAIMKELVAGGYTALPSFYGWYFSSEAYLTDTTESSSGTRSPAPSSGCTACFPDAFMVYINTMSNWSETLTPSARKFVSPYGTMSATHSPAFIKQLQRLDVDVVAYQARFSKYTVASAHSSSHTNITPCIWNDQDEVGCIRNELPVERSRAAFRNLAVAHSYPGTPTLWANVESFTWEGVPNFASSALIPAPFPRILSQLDAVTPYVENIITFTVEAIYQPPTNTAETVGAMNDTQLFVGTGISFNDTQLFVGSGSSVQSPPPWGPPDAQREWGAYTKTLGAAGVPPPAAGSEEQLERQIVHGGVHHAGIGWRVLYEGGTGAPDPAYASGNLTDGLTGAQSPWDQKWVGFKTGEDAVVVLELPEDTCQLQSLGVNFLAAPPVWFLDGDHSKPMPRNVTSWLPENVQWSLSSVSANGLSLSLSLSLARSLSLSLARSLSVCVCLCGLLSLSLSPRVPVVHRSVAGARRFATAAVVDEGSLRHKDATVLAAPQRHFNGSDLVGWGEILAYGCNVRATALVERLVERDFREHCSCRIACREADGGRNDCRLQCMNTVQHKGTHVLVRCAFTSVLVANSDSQPAAARLRTEASPCHTRLLA